MGEDNTSISTETQIENGTFFMDPMRTPILSDDEG